MQTAKGMEAGTKEVNGYYTDGYWQWRILGSEDKGVWLFGVRTALENCSATQPHRFGLNVAVPCFCWKWQY